MKWSWWGSGVSYGEARQRQLAHREGIWAGSESECLALLEHSSVITVGRRAAEGLPGVDELKEHGIAFETTERGGLATYHGPGQLVAYTLVNVRERGIKVRCLVDALEESCIRFLATHSVQAQRKPGAPGVWVGEQKIAAVGLHFSRGVSIHGLALNLCPDLSAYQWISPCGFDAETMTSLKALTGEEVHPREAASSLAEILMKCIEDAGCP